MVTERIREEVKHDKIMWRLNNPNPKKSFFYFIFLDKDDKEEYNRKIENWLHERELKRIEWKEKLTDIPIVKEKEKEKIINYEYSPLKKYHWWNINRFNQWMLYAFSKNKCIFINMELNNGLHESFLVPLSYDRFLHENKTYLIDLNLKYYSKTMDLYCLDYHESLSIPIARKWDIDFINDVIEKNKLIESTAATNPANITKFVNSTFIEQIFAGANLGKKLDLHTILLFIILIVVVVLLVIYCIKSGLIQDMFPKKT